MAVRGDNGRREPAGRRRRSGATILAACAMVLGGVVLLVAAGPGRLPMIGGWVLVLCAFLAITIVTVATVVRKEVGRQTRLVSSTAERWLVEVLPPARVLHLLLERVYGPSDANREVITALLGGEGLAADCADLTISEHTEIDYSLARIDHYNYQLVTEARYSFRNRVPTDTIVIFATSDHLLRDSIISACRLPLFELWFVRENDDTPMFAESVERIKDTVRIGIQFSDERGRVHDVDPVDPGRHLRDIKLERWGDYLSFFRGGGATGETLRRSDYLSTLRIFEVDLHELVNCRAGIANVQRLTVRSAMIQQLVDGFCYWQAPYPCRVERMRFDTTSFDQDDDTDFWFHLKPFTIGSQAGPPTWSTSDGVADLPVGRWLLPGHGMALMWRPQDSTPTAIARARETNPGTAATAD